MKRYTDDFVIRLHAQYMAEDLTLKDLHNLYKVDTGRTSQAFKMLLIS